MRRDPWTCEKVNQFIIDYLEEEVDEQTREQFEAHLQNCPTCAVFLEQYRSTVDVVSDIKEIDIPPALVDRTLDFLRNHYPRGGK
jgi:predicted anti-sigma-YlaC factor YlaD